MSSPPPDFEVEQRRDKADAWFKGIAGLVTINGGGAVALGSLLAAVIDKPGARELLPFVMKGLAWTTFGVVTSTAIYFTVVVQVIYQQRGRFRWRNPAWWATWGLVVVSLFCFARGMWLMGLDAALVIAR